MQQLTARSVSDCGVLNVPDETPLWSCAYIPGVLLVNVKTREVIFK